MRQTIAIVDDHAEIRELVAEYITRYDFDVVQVSTGGELLQLVEIRSVDLVVLDVMMPGEDGLSVCRRLRARSSVPVIFLTALGDDIDRITGLELGADDYLTKPFNPRELLARIRAVLRRGEPMILANQSADRAMDRFGPWRLDHERRELLGQDDVTVALSAAEYRLLTAFVENPRRVLSRETLLDLTVGRQAEPFDRSIDNRVSRLRKKLEADPKNPVLIRTHWGGGYSLEVQVERVR